MRASEAWWSGLQVDDVRRTLKWPVKIFFVQLTLAWRLVNGRVGYGFSRNLVVIRVRAFCSSDCG